MEPQPIEKECQDLIQNLCEREKELNCIYQIFDIIRSTQETPDRRFDEIIRSIPSGMRFPDLTCVSLTLGERRLTTDDFETSPWKLRQPITFMGQHSGTIEIYYRRNPVPVSTEPFLHDEKKMLRTLAELIGNYLEQVHLEEQIHEQRQKITELVEKKSLDIMGTRMASPEKPDWEVVIHLMLKTDPTLFLRITKKMIYHLARTRNENIDDLMASLGSSVGHDTGEGDWHGINMPTVRQDIPFLVRLQHSIFEIAKKTLPPSEIHDLIILWLHQEKARSLVMASHRRGSTLGELTDALHRFREAYGDTIIISPEDEKSIRANLVNRILSNRLEYISIAKEYFRIEDFIGLTDRIVGPSNLSGKIGGKAAGMLLAERIIAGEMPRYPELRGVSFARSWYLSSSCMLEVIRYNDMDEVAHIKYLGLNEIRQAQPFLEQVFKNAAFPAEIMDGLRRIIRDLGDVPIIVRSSSLLEDSFGAAFSGKYKSLFLANTGTEKERLQFLMEAVAEVYASVFAPDPIEYRRERGLLDFSEEMGVIIQEVIGRRIGPYFLPAFAGVAFTHNEFRWSPRIRREDGMLRLVAGLGTRAVDRIADNYPVLISINRPEIKVNPLLEESLRYSQREADVINVEQGIPETVNISDMIRDHGDHYPLLNRIVSVYRDGQLHQPPGLLLDTRTSDCFVTFAGIIDKGPFLPQMKRIMDLLREKIKTPVDVEFAHDGERLCILQCRPQTQALAVDRVIIPVDIPEDRKVFTAGKFVTTGLLKDIEYLVYVDPEGYDGLPNREDLRNVAKVIGDLNLMLPRRKFILMGPGRWGSRGDIKLGVPVKYHDINNTCLLVEIARKKGSYLPELSFGTHFFQDLVEARIHYLPLYPDEPEEEFNGDLFDTAPNHLARLLPRYAAYEGVVKVIHTPDIASGGTLTVAMDGDANFALAYLVPPDA